MEQIIRTLVDKGHRVELYINEHNWYTINVDGSAYAAHTESFDGLRDLILNDLIKL